MKDKHHFVSAVRFERLFFWVALASIQIFFGYATAQQRELQAVRNHLNEHSHAEHKGRDSGPVQQFATHLEKYSGDQYVLIYERWQYSREDAESPEATQMITYTFSHNDLNRASLNLVAIDDGSESPGYWMVEIEVLADAEFIDYKNYSDTLVDGEVVDRSSSKGKARKLALGYFDTQNLAQEFTAIFRAWLDSFTRPTQ